MVVFLSCLGLAAPVWADEGTATENQEASPSQLDGVGAEAGDGLDIPRADPGPRLDVYRSQRWYRAGYPGKDAYADPIRSLLRPRVGWGVFDGDGYRIPAPQFASVVGHSEKVALLRHRRTVAFATGGGLGGAGLGLLIGGAAWGAEADPGRTGDNRKTNLESHQRGVGAAVFFGSAMVGTGLAVILATLSRQRHVARFYSKEEADEAVEARNDRLRKALDLEWEDVEALRRPRRVRPAGADKARPAAGQKSPKSP